MTLIETKCIQCSKLFEPSNKRNIYCSDGCKQEAYRIRNNIETPKFLKPEEEKFQVFKSEESIIIYRDIYTREYTDKQKKIRDSNIELSKYRKQEKAFEEKINNITTRNDSFFSRKIAGIMAFLVTIVSSWALYSLVKIVITFRPVRWGILILVSPFVVLAVLIGLASQRKSDKSHDIELSNLSKYKSDLESIRISLKSLELEISNEESILLSMNQFERVTEKETKEIIEKVKLPRVGLPSIRENDAKQVMTLSDLQNARFNTLEFTGDWKEMMGTPEEKFSVMIYGESGQGKSTFAIKFSEYLANNFGAVLFNSAEEGISLTLQDKLKDLKSDNFFIAHHKDFNAIKKHLKISTCKFVVIDSINHMNLTPENVEELRNMDKTRGFVSIHQVTKKGEFKGDNKFLHNCDIEIVVDKYLPTIKKSRYTVKATV